MEHIIRIAGIYTRRGEQKIQKALEQLPGVESAAVSRVSASAVVQGDISRVQLVKTVVDMGYIVVELE